MDTPLWKFSVSIYQQPGVAAECLALQDRIGVNVNVLLFGIYVGCQFGALLACDDISAADHAIVQWHAHVVRALREVRQHLKHRSARSEAPHAEAIEQLRTQVKLAELESERIESALLTEWCDTRLCDWPRRERTVAITHNCHSVLAHYRAGQPTDLPQRLIESAAQMLRP